MLTAKRARALADSTDKILRCQENKRALEKLNEILPDILERIEQAVSRSDRAIYSIDISSSELRCINDTRVLQDLGYRIEKYKRWPWNGFISW